MKTFAVFLDITMCKSMEVKAESEEQAREIIAKKFKDNPYDVATNFSHLLKYEIEDLYETEDQDE